MTPAGHVVIVSGPPGSGKTTVAAALAETAPFGVHLESDWFFRWIRAGFVPPHLTASHRQNTVVIDIVADAAAGYAEAGYFVVWDGVVGPWFLDRVASRLAARHLDLSYLVLRVDRTTALTRVRHRDGTVEAAGAETMWDQFVDLATEPATWSTDGVPPRRSWRVSPWSTTAGRGWRRPRSPNRRHPRRGERPDDARSCAPASRLRRPAAVPPTHVEPHGVEAGLRPRRSAPIFRRRPAVTPRAPFDYADGAAEAELSLAPGPAELP
ncbi:MAG: AAA family ATPase [Acidimicrobiales bacterium]